MFTFWERAPELIETNKQQLAITKSGIYEFPIDMDSWHLRNTTNIDKSIIDSVNLKYKPGRFLSSYSEFKNPNEVARKSYGGSIYPTVTQVKSILKSVNNNVIKFYEKMVFSLDDIFEKCGPGIYYHFVCRAPSNIRLRNYVLEFNENYEIPQIPNEYATNNIMALPQLLPYMKKAAEERQKQYNKNLANYLIKSGKTINQLTPEEYSRLEGHNYRKLLNAPNKYKNAYNTIVRTRRKSINQQSSIFNRNTRRKINLK